MIKPQRHNAIAELAPLTTFLHNEGNIVEWDTGETKTGLSQPTDSKIDSKLASMISAWDAQEYARNRKAEYPDWGTQLNKIYDDGIAKWKTEMVDPIKAKYPKP